MENSNQPTQKSSGSSTYDLFLDDDLFSSTKEASKGNHGRGSKEWETSSLKKGKGVKLIDLIERQKRLFPWLDEIEGNLEPGVTPLEVGEVDVPEGAISCVDRESQHLEECGSSRTRRTKRKAVKLIDFINDQKKLYPWTEDVPCDESESGNGGLFCLENLNALDEEIAEQFKWLQQISSSNSTRDGDSGSSAKRKKRLTPKKVVAELTQDLNLSKISEECEDHSNSQSPGSLSARGLPVKPSPCKDDLITKENDDGSPDSLFKRAYQSQKSLQQLVSRVQNISKKLDLQEESIKEGCSKKENKENKNMIERVCCVHRGDDPDAVHRENCQKKKFYDPKSAQQYIQQKRTERNLKIESEARRKALQKEETKKRLEQLKKTQINILHKTSKKKEDKKPPWNDEIEENLTQPGGGQYLLHNLKTSKTTARPPVKKPPLQPKSTVQAKKPEPKPSNTQENKSKEVNKNEKEVELNNKAKNGNCDVGANGETRSHLQHTLNEQKPNQMKERTSQHLTALQTSPTKDGSALGTSGSKEDNLAYPSHINLFDKNNEAPTFGAYDLNKPWADRLSAPPFELNPGMRRSLDNCDLKYDTSNIFPAHTEKPLFNPMHAPKNLDMRSASDSRLHSFFQPVNLTGEELFKHLTSVRPNDHGDGMRSFVTLRNKTTRGSSSGEMFSNKKDFASDLPEFVSPSKAEKGVQSDESFLNNTQGPSDPMSLNNVSKLSHPGDSLSLNLHGYRGNAEPFEGKLNFSFTPNSKAPLKEVFANVSIDKGEREGKEKHATQSVSPTSPDKLRLGKNERDSIDNININVSFRSRDSLESKPSFLKEACLETSPSRITPRNDSAVGVTQVSGSSVATANGSPSKTCVNLQQLINEQWNKLNEFDKELIKTLEKNLPPGVHMNINKFDKDAAQKATILCLGRNICSIGSH